MAIGSSSVPPVGLDSASTDADVRHVPLLLLTVVLWAYIVSVYVYRTWYVATGAAVAVVAILALAQALRTTGFLRAIAPVVAYFAVLFASAWWAMYPEDTVDWVAIDSIGIAVFALSFLAGRNAGPGAISRALMTLAIPSVAITVVMYAIDPTAPRTAQYAVALLPFVAPFAYLRALTMRPRWPAILTLAVLFAILVFGRSRTHLGAAAILTLLTAIVFRKSTRAAIRETLIGGGIVVIAIGALTLLPVTRKPVVMMFVRVTHIGVAWGDIVIPAEAVNQERVDLAAVARWLLPDAMPLGIGYGNFIRRFHGVTGYFLSLHNIYTIWLLEGGLLCVAVVLVLVWRHVRALRRYVRSAPTPDQRAYGQACAIASLGIPIIGMFHQVHQTPAFWMLLGLAAACGAEADDVDDVRVDAVQQALPLFERWRRSNPSFPPALGEPLMRTALEQLSACAPGAVVVDLGCGNGSLLPVLHDAGYRAIGVDADPHVVRSAGSRAVAALAEELPLRTGAVDGLFVFSVFQYTDRERALEECRRVLRPGGRIVVIENLADNPFTKLSRRIRRMRGAHYSRYMEPHAHLRWRDRAIYEKSFSDVTYEAHDVVTPLFLFSSALAAPSRSTKNRIVLAALRVVQRLEQRMLGSGWLRGAAWHVVVYGKR
jgi:SAM-dependent methyltransferase